MTTFIPLWGSCAKQIYGAAGTHAALRCDNDGFLQVVVAPGVPLAVAGAGADDAAVVGFPVRIGAYARANPAASAVHEGDTANLITDLNRYLRVSPRSHDYPTSSDRVFEIAPMNLYVDEGSLVDQVNVAADTNYPSDDGLIMMGYADFSLTGQLIAAALETVNLSVWGTNDEDPVPANRIWIQLYGFRTDTNAMANLIACVGGPTTVTFAWDFDNLNYRYVRVYVDVTTFDNTVNVKYRRKAVGS